MAKSLPEIVSDVRTLIGKKKLKAARKTIDKAAKQGMKGPLLKEVVAELLVSEGGGPEAAEAMRDVGRVSKTRVPALVKIAETHLRQNPDDHAVRDVVWELALAARKFDVAVRHLSELVGKDGIDAARRAKELVDRKDEVGAVGIFLLASLGGVSTDRLMLAKRLVRNDVGAKLLEGVATVLRDRGSVDGAVHFALAQLAHRQGDRERFLQSSLAAADELRDEVLTWTGTMDPSDRLDLSLKLDALDQVIPAAGEAPPDSLLAAANRVQGDAVSGRVVRGLAALVNGKPANACRILEDVVRREKSAAGPLTDVLKMKASTWVGAREAFGAVVAEGLWSDKEKLNEAAESLLRVGENDRAEAWTRSARRVLERAPYHIDLRRGLGTAMLTSDDSEEIVKLLDAPEHLAAARTWVEGGHATPTLLRRTAEVAEKYDQGPQAAEWLLRAAKDDKALLAEIGKRLQGSTVSTATALQSAAALLDADQREEAAGFLSRLPLDRETGEAVEDLLRERDLIKDAAFEEISLRCALSLGDAARARASLKAASSGMEALANDALDHPEAARLLAELLIAEGAAPTAVRLLAGRRDAGDSARSLLPLADAVLKKSAKLAAGRLLRARLLADLGRKKDAVRDLRAIPGKEAEADEAYTLLGELEQDAGAGTAVLGRVDILITKGDAKKAIAELASSRVPAAERLERFERITESKPDLDAAQRGRAEALLELKRLPDGIDAHFRRFRCRDVDPAAVANDLEALAGEALEGGDIENACAILERLPNAVGDGADRALKVVGERQLPPLLILRSKLLLQQERTDAAVKTLADLVRNDETSRAQAARALQSIVASGQARPEADFALAEAFDAMGQTPQALAALAAIYVDDITAKENVLKVAEKLIRRADDADARLFIARICLDMRDAGAVTEHCLAARRLRPEARRDVVGLLQSALDLDAFSASTHFALAEAHLAGDEADDAVRHLRAAVEVDRARAGAAIAALAEAAPRSKHAALLWLAAGTTHAEFERDYESAVHAYSHGLEANPTTELKVPLLLGRGDAHAALKQDEAAFNDFDEASDHDLLERRYYEFLRSRHRKKVLVAARAAQERASVDFAAAAEACGRFIRLGMASDAVAVSQTALANDPANVAARYLVGVSLHAAGRYDAAVRALEAARSGAGSDTEIGRAARMLLAESYLDQGDRDKARACLVEIEAVNAAYPGLKTRRGSLAPPADDPHAPPPLFVRPEFPRPTE